MKLEITLGSLNHVLLSHILNVKHAALIICIIFSYINLNRKNICQLRFMNMSQSYSSKYKVLPKCEIIFLLQYLVVSNKDGE